MDQLEAAELEILREDADGLLAKADEVSRITELAHEARASEFLAQVKRRAKIVDDKRKEYVAPLKSVIDNVNADFKSILIPLEQAEAIVKKGMTAFRGAEEFKAKEAARTEAERMAKIAISMAGTEVGTVEDAQVAILARRDATAEAPKTVETQSGKAQFRKSWKFEVVDPYAVEREFCSPDDKLIRDAVKAGLRETCGIRIWEESTPVISY
jgi:hypothetical protein